MQGQLHALLLPAAATLAMLSVLRSGVPRNRSTSHSPVPPPQRADLQGKRWQWELSFRGKGRVGKCLESLRLMLGGLGSGSSLKIRPEQTSTEGEEGSPLLLPRVSVAKRDGSSRAAVLLLPAGEKGGSTAAMSFWAFPAIPTPPVRIVSVPKGRVRISASLLQQP